MTFALPPKFQNPTRYTGPSLASMPAVNYPRAPTTTDNHYPLFTIWRNDNLNATAPDAFGDAWILVKFTANSISTEPPNAIWRKFAFGGSSNFQNIQVDSVGGTGVNPVVPNASGTINLTGGQVVAGTVGLNVIRSHSQVPNEIEMQIQVADVAAVSTASKNGVSHFNSAEFTIDGNGFVSLVGSGSAIEGVVVDAHTPPGQATVTPDGSGNITVHGGQVVAGTNPVRTDSLAANTYTIEVQRSQAVASTNITNNGISHFFNNQFGVDGNGFVTLTNNSNTRPAFSALALNQPNVTGNSAVYTVQFSGGTFFNVGGGFDGTSTFTAPQTGLYLFYVRMLVSNITVANTLLVGTLIVNGSHFDFGTINGGAAVASSGNLSIGTTQLVSMTAAQTATVTVKGVGEVGNTEGLMQGTNDTVWGAFLFA